MTEATERERADAIEARLNRLIEVAETVLRIWEAGTKGTEPFPANALRAALREARATAELAPGHTVMDEYTAKDQAGGWPSEEDET